MSDIQAIKFSAIIARTLLELSRTKDAHRLYMVVKLKIYSFYRKLYPMIASRGFRNRAISNVGSTYRKNLD